MIHLATIYDDGPRDSPLWFLYEEEKIWLFGRDRDSFIKRLQTDPRCAMSVVDFNLESGLLLHVGIRGMAALHPVDREKLKRFVSKYLGDETSWNRWFFEEVVEPINAMVEVQAKTIVAKDVSFFKTCPQLTSNYD